MRLTAIEPERPDESSRAAWAARRRVMEANDERWTPRGRRSRHWRYFRMAMPWLALVLRALGLYERGRRNALDVRLTRLTVLLDDMPAAFDGYRILHLTDPHFDGLPELEERLVDLVGGLRADLLVLTGDYRRRVHGPHEQILPPLARVLAVVAVADGILATLGNHDCADMVEPFERLGIRVLANETILVRRGDDSMPITGFDDVHYYFTEAVAAAAAAAPAGCRIAFVHSPELAEVAAEAGYRFYLCGHTHGGQICLPGGRPILTDSILGRRYAQGLWLCRDMVGYTSCGAGTSGLPVRYFSRGEVTLVTLKRRPPAHGPSDAPSP